MFELIRNRCSNKSGIAVRFKPELPFELNWNPHSILPEYAVCKEDGVYQVEIVSWKKKMTLYRCSTDKGEWYLFSSIKDIDYVRAQEIYRNRFKIEVFSGFKKFRI